MEPKGLFITGTDTDVGKTVVTSFLCRILQDKGYDFGVFKPVQSGVENGLSPDLEVYKSFFRLPDSEELIVPAKFREPQAPTIAAKMEKRAVDIEKVMESFYILNSRHKSMVVEGIGGLMVPVTDSLLVADLIKLFKMPTLVVARPDLGTINHTCLTVAYLKSLDIEIAGLILNRVKDPDDSVFKMVRDEIIRISNIQYLGYLNDFGSLSENIESKVDGGKNGIALDEILTYFGK